MMTLCFNTLAMKADVNYFALLPHHVGMDVVGVIGSDWVLIGRVNIAIAIERYD